MRVVIRDDQAIVRDGLAMLLKLDREIDVVGLAEDGLQAVELVEKALPDLVLMDLKMPGVNGMKATRRIRARFPNVKVLVLTTYDDDEWVFDAIRAGASGYLLKDTPHAEVVAAVKGTVAGRAYMDPAITEKLLRATGDQQPQQATQITDKLTEPRDRCAARTRPGPQQYRHPRQARRVRPHPGRHRGYSERPVGASLQSSG